MLVRNLAVGVSIMADTKLTAMTEAFSDDLTDIQSLFFLGVLSDGTPVSVPSRELKRRVGDVPQVILQKDTDQVIGLSGTWTPLNMESIDFDENAWWDSASKNVLRVPNDDWEEVHFFYQVTWTSDGIEDDVSRLAKIQYTSVTSTKYGFDSPTISVSSVTGLGISHKSIQNGDWNPMPYMTPPMHVESGDQIMLVAQGTGTNSSTITGAVFGIAPFKRR